MLSVADRLDIAELSHRYASCVDRRQFGLLTTVFTADAELVMPDPPDTLEPVRSVAGLGSIVDSMQHLADVPVTLHAVLSSVLDAGATPDAASGRITAQAHHLTTRGSQQRDLVWYLHYADHYRREDGHWLIARRALQIEWIETRPVLRSRATA